MTQEEKQLLLQDLSARLPYGVFVEYNKGNGVKRATKFHGNYLYLIMLGKLQWKDFKPYLRPMSSMTEEEIREFTSLLFIADSTSYGYLKECMLFALYSANAIDWLNAHHFDYRELIEKGLALEAPENLYNIKTE